MNDLEDRGKTVRPISVARQHENKNILALRESSLPQLVKVRKELLCLSILSSQEEEERQGWFLNSGWKNGPFKVLVVLALSFSRSGHQKQVNN